MSASKSKTINYLKRLNRKRNRAIHEIKRKLKIIFIARKLNVAKKNTKPPTIFKKILFPFVNLGIGDAVCHTGLWRELKDHGYIIQLVIEKRSEVLFRNIHFVDEVYTVDTLHISHLKKIDTDVVVSMYSWMANKEILELEILSRINYKYAISVGGWLKYPYNLTLSLPDNFHITNPQKMLLKLLGYPNDHLTYTISPLTTSDRFIEEYLKTYTDKRIIIINPFASIDERSMTEEQLFSLVMKMRHIQKSHFFIIGEPHKLINLNLNISDVSICNFDSLWHTISLVNKADIVITVETAIVHIACALNKNLVSIFYSTNINYNDALQSNRIFAPEGENVRQIIVNRTTRPFDTEAIVQESLTMLT